MVIAGFCECSFSKTELLIPEIKKSLIIEAV